MIDGGHGADRRLHVHLGLVVPGHEFRAVSDPLLRELVRINATLIHGAQRQPRIRDGALEGQFDLEKLQAEQPIRRHLVEQQHQDDHGLTL